MFYFFFFSALDEFNTNLLPALLSEDQAWEDLLPEDWGRLLCELRVLSAKGGTTQEHARQRLIESVLPVLSEALLGSTWRSGWKQIPGRDSSPVRQLWSASAVKPKALGSSVHPMVVSDSVWTSQPRNINEAATLREPAFGTQPGEQALLQCRGGAFALVSQGDEGRIRLHGIQRMLRPGEARAFERRERSHFASIRANWMASELERAYGKGTSAGGRRRRKSLFETLDESQVGVFAALEEPGEAGPWVCTFLSSYGRLARGDVHIQSEEERDQVECSEDLLNRHGRKIAQLAMQSLGALPPIPLTITPEPLAKVMLAHALTAAADMALMAPFLPPDDCDKLLARVERFANEELPAANLSRAVIKDTLRALEHHTVAPTDPAWGLWTAVERLAKKSK